jgi:hypothetical protein
MLRISLDAQIEDLEQLFETAHLNYLQQTAQRTHDFKELTHKDQILDVDINQKKKKIDNLQVISTLVVFTLVMLNVVVAPRVGESGHRLSPRGVIAFSLVWYCMPLSAQEGLSISADVVHVSHFPLVVRQPGDDQALAVEDARAEPRD